MCLYWNEICIALSKLMVNSKVLSCANHQRSFKEEVKKSCFLLKTSDTETS